MARALVLPDSPRRRQGLAGYLAARHRCQAPHDRAAARGGRPHGGLCTGRRRIALVYHRSAQCQRARQGTGRASHQSEYRVRRRRQWRRMEKHRWRPVLAAPVGRAGHDGVRGNRHCAKRPGDDLCRHRRVDSQLWSDFSRHRRVRQHRWRRELDPAQRRRRAPHRPDTRLAHRCQPGLRGRRKRIRTLNGCGRNLDHAALRCDFGRRHQCGQPQHDVHQCAIGRHLQDHRRRRHLDQTGGRRPQRRRRGLDSPRDRPQRRGRRQPGPGKTQRHDLPQHRRRRRLDYAGWRAWRRLAPPVGQPAGGRAQ
jgi:hypothetical protein